MTNAILYINATLYINVIIGLLTSWLFDLIGFSDKMNEYKKL